MFQPLFIDLFDFILVDLSGTLMVGGDRIGDYGAMAATFQELGGELERERVVEIFGRVIPEMWDRYRAVGTEDEEFAPFLSVLREHEVTKGVREKDLALLDRALGLHEMGVVPPSHREVLRHLASVNRLALLSDIWASSDPFTDHLEEVGILSLFDTVIFSSDHNACKPSGTIFRLALEQLGAPSPAKALMIGNDYERDIVGARNVGMATILVDPTLPPEPESGDRVVSELEEVLRVR